MKVIKIILFIAVFFSAELFASSNCSMLEPGVRDAGMEFFFTRKKIPTDSLSPIVQLELTARDCNSGEIRYIGDMPYLAETGGIVSIFKFNKYLFVIHKVEISSDTGMSYASPYYTVLAYSINGLKTELDHNISKYFGDGADIINGKGVKIYQFPYKTRGAMESELRSYLFRSIMSGIKIKASVTRKSFMYSEPIITKKTKSYLVLEDLVEIVGKEAGWCRVNYENNKFAIISGWVLCDSLKIKEDSYRELP